MPESETEDLDYYPSGWSEEIHDEEPVIESSALSVYPSLVKTRVQDTARECSRRPRSIYESNHSVHDMLCATR